MNKNLGIVLENTCKLHLGAYTAILSAGLGRENGTNKHTQSWILHVVKFVFALGRIAVKIFVFLTLSQKQNSTTQMSKIFFDRNSKTSVLSVRLIRLPFIVKMNETYYVFKCAASY